MGVLQVEQGIDGKHGERGYMGVVEVDTSAGHGIHKQNMIYRDLDDTRVTKPNKRERKGQNIAQEEWDINW
jgi:hypothetical protein